MPQNISIFNLPTTGILSEMVTEVYFFSDFGNNYLFLKINTRIWKINYQNIFMELNPQFPQSVQEQ